MSTNDSNHCFRALIKMKPELQNALDCFYVTHEKIKTEYGIRNGCLVLLIVGDSENVTISRPIGSGYDTHDNYIALATSRAFGALRANQTNSEANCATTLNGEQLHQNSTKITADRKFIFAFCGQCSAQTSLEIVQQVAGNYDDVVRIV